MGLTSYSLIGRPRSVIGQEVPISGQVLGAEQRPLVGLLAISVQIVSTVVESYGASFGVEAFISIMVFTMVVAPKLVGFGCFQNHRGQVQKVCIASFPKASAAMSMLGYRRIDLERHHSTCSFH